MGEREGERGVREGWGGYRKLSSQPTVIFFDVTFHKALCFPFIHLVKGLKGFTSCFVTPAGVKWELSSFSSHKLMLKADYKSSEDECGIALPMEGREAEQHRPG